MIGNRMHRMGAAVRTIGRVLFPLAFALPVLFIGCGDDNPSDPADGSGDSTGSGRGTIDSLLAVYFPDAYSSGDSVAYAKALDARYSFQSLPSDPDDPVEDLFWDFEEEMRIAGTMFRGTPNTNGQSIESITLSLNVRSVTPSFATDEPDDEEWFDVASIIDMTVVLNDPNQTDGTGILVLLIDSNQKFVVTKDSPSSRDWVIVKQEDQLPINKGRAPQATEDASWSDIKGLFRPVPDSELLTTEETSWGAVKDLFR